MNRYNTLGRLSYNRLDKIKYNTQYVERLRQLTTRLGARPVALDMNLKQVAVLENSYDVIIEQEVNSIDEISFSIPMRDPKRRLLQNEGYIQMFDTIYVVREIRDRKKDRITEVLAEAIWYDIMYADVTSLYEWESVQPAVMLADTLNGTGWRVGTVDYTNERTLREGSDKNPLEVLTSIADLYGGELVYDTQAKTVSLIKPQGIFTGASIQYDKNADDIEAVYDTRELFTRIYATGKNGLTIADANNGTEYVEDLTYTNKVHVKRVSDERYTNPFTLKEMAEQALEVYSKPRATYTVKLSELSNRSGLSHERFFIGGIVRVYDKELGLDVNTRIMHWSYNVIEPWRTELTLESKPKTLSDLLTGASNLGDEFSSEDTASEAEMLSLHVFNYLMNSRADDGLAYWEVDGWKVDPANGHSGSASFTATGDKNKTKYMYQTVYPSSRDTYALSFRAYAENIDTGANGRVGVEVEVTYEDGSTETKWINLA